jgi:hypothetical protein
MGALHRTVAAQLIGLVAVSAVVLTACASSATTAGRDAPASNGSTASAAASSSAAVPVAAPACPAKYQATNSVWVPAQPQGVDGQSGLVPKSAPSAAVICAYLHPDNGALTGSHALTGSLAAIPATMGSAPAKTDSAILPCPQYFRAVDADDYLIGLAYPGGQLWVAVPRFHCSGASNGEFTTTTNLGDTVNAWYEAGAATAVASPSQS